MLCVFVTVFDVQLYGSECFFRRKTFAVKIIYRLGGFCFRTILISSNGNICYSLFTLSVVVVSRFASHLVTGFSYELELIVVCLFFVGLFAFRSV